MRRLPGRNQNGAACRPIPNGAMDTQARSTDARKGLLRIAKQGYQSDHGMIYFAGSRTAVNVPFTAELERQTRDMVAQTHAATHLTVIPSPLEDSPKCVGCSVAGICMCR